MLAIKTRFNARRFRGMAAAAMVGLALATFAPAAGSVQASSARTLTYTYFAHDFYVLGPDLAARIVADKTGHHTAPLGRLSFVPSGDQVTLTIDDRGTVDGLLDVTVGQRNYRHLCISVRQPTVVSGLTPGQPVYISIWAVTYGPWTPCGLGGTTGTLTISG